MLIRSQDKRILINLDQNDLSVEGGEIHASPPTDDSMYSLLGEYESENRAIEVLDEIAKAYLDCNYFEGRSGYFGIETVRGPVGNAVFQMPER